MKTVTYHALREYAGAVELIRVTKEVYNGGGRQAELVDHVAFYTDHDDAISAMRKANGV